MKAVYVLRCNGGLADLRTSLSYAINSALSSLIRLVPRIIDFHLLAGLSRFSTYSGYERYAKKQVFTVYYELPNSQARQQPPVNFLTITEQLSYENAPLIVVKPPGPKSQELLAEQSRLETQSAYYNKAFPFAIDSAKGSTIRDVDGNLFIDWISGMCVLNLGHNNPAVVAAVRSQEEKVWHTLETPTSVRIEFLKQIHSVLPGALKGAAKALFTVTGGDACEAAVGLARYVTKRSTIIAFQGSYHGGNQGIVSSTSNKKLLGMSGTLRQGVFHLPFPYSYRFPFPVEKKGDETKVLLEYLEGLLQDPHSGLDEPAGIIVEPIQCEGGYIIPPSDFLPGLREIADKHQIPLIADEVQTGFGRTGKFWASELTNTTPDIMCISKAMGGGIPVSMIAYRQEYDKSLPEMFRVGTYRANALALAAGAASIEYIKKENLLERAQTLGRKTKSAFERIADSSNIIGDVRGVGFMIGMELVESKETKKPAPEKTMKLRRYMFENGLLMQGCGHFGNVMRFMAPLTISESLLERGLEIFERGVKVVTGP